jgi:hypothetical protein
MSFNHADRCKADSCKGKLRTALPLRPHLYGKIGGFLFVWPPIVEYCSYSASGRGFRLRSRIPSNPRHGKQKTKTRNLGRRSVMDNLVLQGSDDRPQVSSPVVRGQ